MTTDDIQLVKRAQAGESHAFGELVLGHQVFVYNLALRAVGDGDEAQDLAQEAFLRAWQGLAGFRGAASFRTWLYRIVMNLCYNRTPQLKREMAQISLEDGHEGALGLVVGEINTPGSHRWDPEAEMVASELRALLHRQIEMLPPTYRLLVMLRYQQGLSYEEIAEVVRIPLGTVKTGLFRAHARLRSALMDSEGTRGSWKPTKPGKAHEGETALA